MSLKVIKEFCAAVVDSLMKQKEWIYMKNSSLCKSKNDNSTVVLLLGPNLVDNVNKVAIQMHHIVTKKLFQLLGTYRVLLVPLFLGVIFDLTSKCLDC